MQSQVLENPHIGSQSYLSSDYLNLFTEIVILIEEVAHHPVYLNDIREWAPKSYCEHFNESSLPFSDLAIWAYENAPKETLEDFNGHIGRTIDLIQEAQSVIETALKNGTLESLASLGAWLSSQAHDIRTSLDQAGDLIDRDEHHLTQDDIDKLMGF